MAVTLREVWLLLGFIPVYTFTLLYDLDWQLQKPGRLLRLELILRFLLFALSLSTAILLLVEWRRTFDSHPPWSLAWLLSTALLSAVYTFSCAVHLLVHLTSQLFSGRKSAWFPNSLNAFFTTIDVLLLFLAVVGVYITVSLVSVPHAVTTTTTKNGFYEVVGERLELVHDARRLGWARVLLGLELSRAAFLLLASMLGAILRGRRQEGLRPRPVTAAQALPEEREVGQVRRAKVSLDPESLKPEFGSQFKGVIGEKEGEVLKEGRDQKREEDLEKGG